MSHFPVTPRNCIRRLAERARYDKATVYAILDISKICHVGIVDGDAPVVIPTIFGRNEETLYFHGANESRLMLALEAGAHACITVTHLDGLVLARSAFHHGLNYRSVVAFGHGAPVTGEEERLEALRLISKQMLPGRWEEVRPPTPKELARTKVVKVQIEEASAKARQGGPKDSEEDYALGVWAGVVPIADSCGLPIPDERLADNVALPASVAALCPKRR